jgi:hypothetical protein
MSEGKSAKPAPDLFRWKAENLVAEYKAVTNPVGPPPALEATDEDREWGSFNTADRQDLHPDRECWTSHDEHGHHSRVERHMQVFAAVHFWNDPATGKRLCSIVKRKSTITYTDEKRPVEPVVWTEPLPTVTPALLKTVRNHNPPRTLLRS